MKRLLLGAGLLLALATPALGQTTMCDPDYESCRRPIIAAMDAEMLSIDMFVWFGEDYRYVAALERAKRRGVSVRVIGNYRWSSGPRKTFMDGLRAKNIPTRVSRGVPSHVKAIVLGGQSTLIFTGGNWTANALRPVVAHGNYTDEVVFTTHDPWLVQSHQRLFEDIWTDNSLMVNFAGEISLSRHYPRYDLDPRVAVSMDGDQTEILQRDARLIDRESVGIDVIMYRVQDPYTKAALVRALQRGVPVRLLTDPIASREYHGQGAYERAILAAGAQIKRRTHAGMTHEKFIILHGTQQTIIPSNNWDQWVALSSSIRMPNTPITNDGHPTLYDWAVAHFEHKWTTPSEFR